MRYLSGSGCGDTNSRHSLSATYSAVAGCASSISITSSPVLTVAAEYVLHAVVMLRGPEAEFAGFGSMLQPVKAAPPR